MSTIGEERRSNPRLQVPSVDAYIELMNNLNLPNPKMMDVAVPANMLIGLPQDAVAEKGWAVSADAALDLLGRPDVALVDLAEERARAARRHSRRAACALHRARRQRAARRRAARARLDADLAFFCAFGERSAMAVNAAQEAGIGSACHIEGGMAAWKKAGGPVEH